MNIYRAGNEVLGLRKTVVFQTLALLLNSGGGIWTYVKVRVKKACSFTINRVGFFKEKKSGE